MDTQGNIFHVNFLGYSHWFMSIIISQMEDHSISIDQASHVTSIVAKYLDAATVMGSKKFYKTTFPSDMIVTKSGASISNEKIYKLTRDFNIKYRPCIWSLMHLLFTKVHLSFSVHKLAKFSSNSGKLHFESLVHLSRYIRDNKTLGMKYYDDMNDSLLSGLLIKGSIKTRNQLMDFYAYNW